MANHHGAALAAIFLAGCTGTYTPLDPDRIPEGDGDGEMSAAERLFADQVVPILQARGLFRTEYTGTTLRDHYGLPRPAGRLVAPQEATA